MPDGLIIMLHWQSGFQGCLLICIYGLDQDQPLFIILRHWLKGALAWMGLRGSESGSGTDEEQEEEADAALQDGTSF
jgi:hypothetical protein